MDRPVNRAAEDGRKTNDRQVDKVDKADHRQTDEETIKKRKVNENRRKRGLVWVKVGRVCPFFEFIR